MSDDIESALIERPDRLQLVKLTDLVNRTSAPWQVRGLFRERSLIQIYGPPGGFKSFVALDVGMSLASGLAWHGREVVTPGLVIYIAGEGGGGMVQRGRAWLEQHQIHPSKVNMLFVVESVAITATSEDMDILIHRIQGAIEWCPEGTLNEEDGFVYDHDMAQEWPVLIIIDTLARCYVGDENKTEDMGQFVQGLDLLKQEFNASILVVHHSGRDASHERGNTAFRGACDTIYRLDADRDTQHLILSCEKMKDSRETEPIELAYREVQVERRSMDDPLEDLTSIILESEDVNSDAKEQKMLQQLADEGPLTWQDWLGLTGMSKPTFNRYVVRLRKSGQIIKENTNWQVVRSHSK